MAAVAAVAAGAVVVATVLVVSRGEDGDEAFSVPVVAGAALPAGTELWDGMRVPAGARLLGRVFPPDDAPQREGGFAVLAVDGDPLAVYETLARQARRLGFDNAEPDAEACLSFEISGRTRQYDVVQAGQEVAGVQCSTETSVQRPGAMPPTVRISPSR